jgi:hypothetical protein
MKTAFKLVVLVFFTTWITTLPGCKRNDEIATLITTLVYPVTATAALTGGTVTSSRDNEVLSREVCWGPAQYPTVAGFSIGTNVFLGLGYNDADFSMRDFWERAPGQVVIKVIHFRNSGSMTRLKSNYERIHYSLRNIYNSLL